MYIHYRKITTALIMLLAGIMCVAADNADERVVVHYADQGDLSSSRVDGAVQDKRGFMWFATWNGLDCFDGYDFHWVKMQPGDGAHVENDRIREIRLSPEGNIWCFTNDGVFEFDLDTYTFDDLPTPLQKKLLPTRSKENWPGMFDRQGNFWTADLNGIYKATYKHHPAQMLEETAGQHIRAFMLDKQQRLWMGARNEMILRVYDRQNRLIHSANMGYMIFRIMQSRDGYIWMGTKSPANSKEPSMVLKVNPETFAIEKKLPIREVYDIQEDKLGRLWFASFSQGVLCCPNPTAAEPTLTKSFGGKRVRKIHITPSGNILAATSRGLLVGTIDYKNAQDTHFHAVKRDGNRYSSLASNSLIDIEQDKKGNLFIGTANSGIDMISEKALMNAARNGGDAVFKHFSVATSTIISDFCSALRFYNETTLMVVSNNNMMLFNPYTNTTTNYNSNFFDDRCRFSEAKPVKLPDGTWLFGSEYGAYKVSEYSLTSRGYIPPLVWSYVEVNGGAENYSRIHRDTLHLNADERNVRIGFAAIDYVENSGILYRTRLGDSPWTYDSSDRSISLFGLKPGTYRLQVQSTDRYGRWVNNTKMLCVIVESYWYETWWARTIIGLLILALLVGVYFNYVYIHRLKTQQQEALKKYMQLLAKPEKTTTHETVADESGADVTDKDDDSKKDEEKTEEVMREFKPEDQVFLDKIRGFIETKISDSDISIDDMAAESATSRSTLNRRLRSLLGVTAAQLIIDARMQHAKQLMDADPYISVADLAYKCGYTDPRYFSRCFKTKYGISPTEYKGI